MIVFASFLMSFIISTTAFTPIHPSYHRRCDLIRRQPMMMVVDPTLLADGAVAVASFAAGILTQVPRIQAMEQNVTATTMAAAEQIQEYQDRLYALDQEYEQGTQALKEQFEELRETQLRKQKRQLVEDFEYKLKAQIASLKDTYERQLKEKRSEWLAQQLDQIGDLTGAEKQAELMNLRIQQQQLQERNQKLAQLLEESKEQVSELKKQQQQGNGGWMSFFSRG